LGRIVKVQYEQPLSGSLQVAIVGIESTYHYKNFIQVTVVFQLR
jgi:hypothetical protein